MIICISLIQRAPARSPLYERSAAEAVLNWQTNYRGRGCPCRPRGCDHREETLPLVAAAVDSGASGVVAGSDRQRRCCANSAFSRQVELMSAESQDLEPLRSVPLVISTYTAAATARAVHKVPRSAFSGQPQASARVDSHALTIVVLAIAFTVLGCAFIVVGAWVRCQPETSEEREAPRLVSISRCVAHKTVTSPLEVVAIHKGKFSGKV